MFIKYPRTEHLSGSKFLDLGSNFSSTKLDEGFSFSKLSNKGQVIVIEEKMDGIGLGFGFIDGQFYIQHRGHVYQQKDLQFGNIPYYIKDFYNWFLLYEELFYTILEDRYFLFGEWLQYKHTVFYNALPSLFMEYDIYDKQEGYFLSTSRRQHLLKDYKTEVASVKVLQTSTGLLIQDIQQLLNHTTYSIGKNDYWRLDLENICNNHKLNYQEVLKSTLNDELFEGFYIKTEDQDQVLGRYKWIRKNFIDLLLEGEHWKNNPIIKNISVKQDKSFF